MVSTTCTHARSLCGTRLLRQQRIITSKRNRHAVSCQAPRLNIRLNFSCKQSEACFV